MRRSLHDPCQVCMVVDEKKPKSSDVWEIESNIIRDIEGEDCSNNEKFDIHVFIPDSFQETPSPREPEPDSHHILIMVNGLAEYNDAVYLGDTGFCELFKKIGIATVFLPLPFHFNRLSEEDQNALAEEIERKKHGDKSPFRHPDVVKILNDEIRFYFGYEQIREDIVYVTERIIDSKKSGKLPEDTQISLWGFSIGGLGILSAYMENPDLYNACILVHSGANFKTLGINADILTDEECDDLRKKMLALPVEKRPLRGRAPNIRRNEYELFKMLFIGEEPDKLKEAVSGFSNRILIFIGEEDNVNPSASVISTLRPAKGLAMHTLPGLRHDNVNRPFKRWLNYEVRVIKAFLDFHPLMPT